MSNRSKLDEAAEKYAGVKFVDVNKFGENVYSSENLNNLENARLKINAYKAGFELAKQENKEIEDENKNLRNALEFCLKNFLDIPVENDNGVLTTGRIIAKKALKSKKNNEVE